MQIIVSGRRSGKTTKLIELCAKNGGYIVCMSKKHAHHIQATADAMGLEIPLPITFDDFKQSQYYIPGIQRLYIDDVEILLQYMAGCRVEAITMTGEGLSLTRPRATLSPNLYLKGLIMEQQAFGMVRVMNSFNYNNFEASEPYPMGTPIEEINELRKKCQRLVDEAVRQYKKAKDELAKTVYEPGALGRQVKAIKENFPKSDWTPDQKATVKEWEDYCWRQAHPYDYEDDWGGEEDDHPEEDVAVYPKDDDR